MLEKIEKEYKAYLKGSATWQQKNLKPSLPKLNIISGITCIGKNYLIKECNLPSLYSYKTGRGNFRVGSKQSRVAPEEFYRRMSKAEYFDIYYLNNVFYAYSLSDYFFLTEKHGQVFIDVSIESVFHGLRYFVNKIFILDYPQEQHKINIKKRIEERCYTTQDIQMLNKQVDLETKMLEKIKTNKNKRIMFISSPNEFKRYLCTQ